MISVAMMISDQCGDDDDPVEDDYDQLQGLVNQVNVIKSTSSTKTPPPVS